MKNRRDSFDIESVAKAIEADAGEPLADLRQALTEMREGRAGHAGQGVRVTTPEQILLREARSRSGLSQVEFAKRIATPAATLRDWEQGRFKPPGAVVCLLRLLAARPELSDELVAG